jgi:hypothetical protein
VCFLQFVCLQDLESVSQKICPDGYSGLQCDVVDNHMWQEAQIILPDITPSAIAYDRTNSKLYLNNH